MDEIINKIKKDFFLFRNGIVADTLRKIYNPGKIIFGLNIPQLMELSKKYPHDLRLSQKLWSEKNIRESRLLAMYLMPVSDLIPEDAKNMILDVENNEEAELLAFKVLRNLPYAKDLYNEMKENNQIGDSSTYCIEMIRKNLVACGLS